MANPERIFDCRLEESEDYSEAEKEELRIAFAELLEMNREEEANAGVLPNLTTVPSV